MFFLIVLGKSIFSDIQIFFIFYNYGISTFFEILTCSYFRGVFLFPILSHILLVENFEKIVKNLCKKLLT